ncbi:hypothetical protein [Variovorax sp. dw_954]|uniref:hypothetical protein n=1 Tax=Variovorax sp. dw_954 TaxID=2720078 RepID=UPI001BD50B26|nr:hypothetical protein [Variovorax sp. dw_954]
MTDRTPRRPSGIGRTAKWSAIRSMRSTSGEIRTREAEARLAWTIAVRERETLQARIVYAFRDHVEAGGPGPAEADLALFAQAAVAEQRMALALARARSTFATRRR